MPMQLSRCRGSCGFICVQSHVVLIGHVKQYFAYESQHQHDAFDKTGNFKVFVDHFPYFHGEMIGLDKFHFRRGANLGPVTSTINQRYKARNKECL